MQTIRLGSRGQSVLKLQQILGIPADGVFGPQTRNAVRTFQSSNNLTVDGIVGPSTWRVLNQDSIQPTQSYIRDIINANKDKLVTKTNSKNNRIVEYDPSEHLIVVGIRGFYESMGSRNSNNRGIYDDAQFVVTPNRIVSYQGNTDPGGFRRGSGTGRNKGMACLNTGVWFYGKGPHRGASSFRQCCPFTVTRDGTPNYKDTGWFGINWHTGGDRSTSSLGCQTNKPRDFANLRSYIYSELDRLKNPQLCHDWASGFNATVGAFPYILIDQSEIRKGNLVV